MTILVDRATGRLRIARRLGWGVVDQAVSSLQNFLLGAYIAKSLGPASLGAFALALLAYGIVLNASRGLSTDPLLVRYTGRPDIRWQSAVAASSAVALAVGIIGGLACIAFGLVLGRVSPLNPTASAFFVLGTVLPMLTMQDSWRYAFFASAQGLKAFINDVVWTVAMIVLLVVLETTTDPSLPWALAAFGGSAALAALLGSIQANVVPSPKAVMSWLRKHRDLGARFLAENVTLGASGQVRSVVVAAIGGLVAVGAIRGAEMLIGPVIALLMGVSQVAVPEAARSLERGRDSLVRTCLMLSVGLSSLALAWGITVLLLFPFGMGEFVLGSVWPSAHALIPGVMISAAAGCLHVGPSAGLRALNRADLTLPCQLTVTILLITLGAIGALLWAAPGAVWGTAIAAIAGAAIWWRQLWKAERSHFAGEGTDHDSARATRMTDDS
jgi:O-antigen/teichoic acid export membrane protein